MPAHSIETDNANLAHKIMLRQMATKGLEELRVLDCYAGENRIWSNFETAKYYGIEKKIGKGRNLWADNERVIESLDLSQFNVIDLDGYGFPVKPLEIISASGQVQSGTIVIYTAIGNAMSTLSGILAKRYGIDQMLKESKVMFNSMAHELFDAYLYDIGVRTVWEYEEPSPKFRKRYGFFVWR